ncbi:mycothiol S-conjugate amidase [Rarobacter faecitabidus]|uniref:Mycothiol S-conjugate amidase n=1 Tax=Rarobacter faecitabidus TaxID=13243 RepID=A0A542ZU11_RARFA|nr:mycothiol S-conjugate amidase [Rarobacter faecitabidus]
MAPVRRILAVHAHPDDESSKGAATTARYASEGVDVLVVSCTGGERGDVLNPAFAPVDGGLEAMREVRRHEMAAAAAALGVGHRWLGFVDSGLPQGDPLPPLPVGSFAAGDLREQTAALVRVIREFRPHVVTTYDPMGGYPHPDHIRSHQVAVAAFLLAGDAEQFADAGEPWAPLKLYYNHDFSLERSKVLHEAMLDAGLDSPYGPWIELREEWAIHERPVTTRIAVEDHYDARDGALLAHASQIDPNGFFFAVPRELESRIWPWEEYELAAARVQITLPEVDLFAGIDALASDDELQEAARGRDVSVAGYEELGDPLSTLFGADDPLAAAAKTTSALESDQNQGK